MVDYGKGIRIVRAARGITAAELAERAGMSGSYISLLENGHRVPSTDALDVFAAALGAPVWLIVLLGSSSEEAGGHALRLGGEVLDHLTAH